MFKRQRLEPKSEQSQYEWNLPAEMLQYLEKQFNIHIKDTDLKVNILLENPVPDNVQPVRILGDFFNDVLEEQKKRSHININNVHLRLQERTRQILGPLCKAWYRVEETRAEQSSVVDTDELLHYLDQTVVLVGQAFWSLSYQRRLNVLLSVGQESFKAKTVLNSKLNP